MVKVVVIYFETDLQTLLTDDPELGLLFEAHDAENPDIMLLVYRDVNFLNRGIFVESRTVLKSMFKYGATLQGHKSSSHHAIVGSQLMIQDTTVSEQASGSVFNVRFSTTKNLYIIVCCSDSCEAVAAEAAEGTRCLCVTGDAVSENAIKTLRSFGFVGVASLDDVESENRVHFFLSPAPKDCEVNTLTLGSETKTHVAVIEFT